MTIPQLLHRLARQQAEINVTLRHIARREAARVPSNSRPDVRLIQQLVAAHYGFTLEQLLGYRRTDDVVLARHMAIALASEFVPLRATALAAAFCRTGELVNFASAAIVARRAQSPAVEQAYQALRTRIQSDLAPLPGLAAA